MSSSVSLEFRRQILDRVFRQVPMSTIGYVALTRDVAPANSTGTDLLEPSGFGYARQRYDMLAANWQFLSTTELVSTLAVDFGTATGYWGLIQGWAYCSASTSGLLLASGPLTLPRRIDFGTEVDVKAGALVFSLGDASA